MYELFFDSQRTSRHDAVFLNVFDDNYVICTTVVPHRIKSVRIHLLSDASRHGQLRQQVQVSECVVHRAQGSQPVFAANVVDRQLVGSGRVVGRGGGGQRAWIEQVVHCCRDETTGQRKNENKTTALGYQL